MSTYVRVDVRNGEMVKFDGAEFAWNDDKTLMIHVKEPPHFGSPGQAQASVFVNNVQVGHMRRGRKEILWSVDSKTAILLGYSGHELSEILVLRRHTGTKWIIATVAAQPPVDGSEGRKKTENGDDKAQKGLKDEPR